MSGKIKEKRVFVLLHNIRSVHNVGSMFRTADAAGVSKMFLTGYTARPADRFGREVKALSKVALGAEKNVEWEYERSPVAVLNRLKKQGVKIVGVEQDKRAVDYKKEKISRPACFLVGNETEGLPKKLLDKCDVIAEIPMLGKKESLNVSVSFGIALFRMLGI